jgi:Arc/MetJ-type ribon-helix-helix transcriptional regulator
MGKSTSIILGYHFDHLIHHKVQSGRYATLARS